MRFRPLCAAIGGGAGARSGGMGRNRPCSNLIVWKIEKSLLRPEFPWDGQPFTGWWRRQVTQTLRWPHPPRTQLQPYEISAYACTRSLQSTQVLRQRRIPRGVVHVVPWMHFCYVHVSLYFAFVLLLCFFFLPVFILILILFLGCGRLSVSFDCTIRLPFSYSKF